MSDVETMKKIREQFRETSALPPDNRVLCKATYTQHNSSGEPHLSGDLLFVLVNEVEVGKISFEFGEEKKSKTIELDVTEHLTEIFNFVKVKALIDKDFLEAGNSSEVEFSIRVRGKRRVKEEFEAKLPIRFVESAWLIPPPA